MCSGVWCTESVCVCVNNVCESLGERAQLGYGISPAIVAILCVKLCVLFQFQLSRGYMLMCST